MRRGVLLFLVYLLAVFGMNAEKNLMRSTPRNNSNTEKRIFTRIDAGDGLSDNQVYHILQLKDGRIAITTNGNINIYDGASFTYVHYEPSTEQPLPGYHGAYHVYSGINHLVWIKSFRTVRCFDLQEQRYHDNIDSLLQARGADISRPDDLFFDRDLNMWTVKDGVIRDVVHDNRPYRLTPTGELQDIESKGDTLLLFYSSGLMEAVDRHTSTLLFSSNAYADTTDYRASSLVKINSSGDLCQIRTDFNHRSIFLHYSFTDRKWTEIMRVPYLLHTFDFLNDSTAYVTGEGGLLHIDLPSETVTPITSLTTIDGTLPTKEFNTVHIDNQGGMWIGTYFDGVLYSHPERVLLQSSESPEMWGWNKSQLTVLPPSSSPDFYAGQVNCALRDSKGLLWLGTPDGIKIFRDSTLIKRLYAEDGLSNNNIKALVEDGHGKVWAATGNGINSITHIGDTYSITSFDDSKGALSSQYFTNGAYYAPDSTLLFEGRSGWTKIPTQNGLSALITLHPLITRIESDSVSFFGQENFTLPYNYSNLDFTVASLNYISPETTGFYMRLRSNNTTNDTIWRKIVPENRSGVLKLSLPHLAPGNYTLDLKVTANDHSPESTPLTVQFTVTPPWWKSTGAYVIYALTAILLLSVIALLYIKAQKNRLIRRHNEEKMLMRMTGLIERCNYYEQRITEENAKEEKPQESSADTLSDDDRQFITRAIELVEASMGKGGYNVEQLSRELCMERTGLYKRMTALLDQSPSAFIKGIRLNHAARLVKEGKMSMAEIAEYTGFSSSSYMSKCFVEQWGCTPLEYAKTH